MRRKSAYLFSFVLVLGLVSNVNSQIATNPIPVDGVLHAATWVGLSWTPGVSAVSHNVYFGESFADVNAGTAEVFRGTQAATNLIVGMPGFLYPAGLVPDTAYYWRIDEVEAGGTTIHKGDVWSFAIAPATAYDPDPADGAGFVDLVDVTLSWTPGMKAKLHHVYFGDNFADVNDGTGGTYKGPKAGPTFTPGTLARDTAYYWRVDEFDGLATHKGDAWRFRTIPPITDPNLICWWMLDEGTGVTAFDWSGHGNNGTLNNDPEWVDGYDGYALHFGGDFDPDTVVYSFGAAEPWPAGTVTLWVKADTVGQDEFSSAFSSHLPNNLGFQLDVDGLDPGSYRYNNGGSHEIGPVTTDWIHLAAAWDGTSMHFYYNGSSAGSLTVAAVDTTFNQFAIGRNRNAANWLAGTIDDFRAYNKTLTQDEIKLVMKVHPLRARRPSPANGSAPDIDGATSLSWSPGDNAAQHDVYFGTDKNAVTDADTSDTSGIYRGRQAAASYTIPGALEWNSGPYYWRIDEYNTDATISTGSVWSFMVADYLIVDDFESYNDLDPSDPESNRIFKAWIDGYDQPTNGSIVGYDEVPFAERTIVHGGSQAIPLFYDNSGKARYSEATLTLTQRDWTKEGVGTLTVWFRGDSANTTAPMYIILNGSATVYHDNPDAALAETWAEWNIPLTDFSNQGVVLTNVNSITIGLGDRNSPQPSGSGKMYFDDIRLYRPR